MQPKKQLIIETALELFSSQGIHAVGINEILKQSKIAKKTLYSYFSAKDDLVVATLQLRDQRFIDWLTSELTSTESPQQAILQLFNALDDWFNHRVEVLGPFRGCFFINAIAEFSDQICPIYLTCQQHKNNVRQLLKSHVVKCVIENQQENLLNAICALKEGAITQARVQGDLAAAKKLLPIVDLLIFKTETHKFTV